MSTHEHRDDTLRPRDVCRALLAALEASEGRRRQRKRDQTPDAIGLAVKRDLLQQAVDDDPQPDRFEEWLLNYPLTRAAPDLAGPAFAMARAVFDEWRLAHTSAEFRHWLEHGAPSDDTSEAAPQNTESSRSGSASLGQHRFAPPPAGRGRSAIVLAGGKSSRMGRPKALLLFDNEPLIAHIVTALRSLCTDVVVVGAPDQALPPLPATVIRDQVAYQGPVGGICYGLAAVSGEVAIVVACDSAFLSLPLLSHLLDRIPEHDVVVPDWGGRLQPLHAVYRKTVLPILEQQLARGELRPVHLFDKVRTCRIDEDEVRRFDPDGSSFFNMNTPEDYAEALLRWETVHRRPMRGAV